MNTWVAQILFLVTCFTTRGGLGRPQTAQNDDSDVEASPGKSQKAVLELSLGSAFGDVDLDLIDDSKMDYYDDYDESVGEIWDEDKDESVHISTDSTQFKNFMLPAGLNLSKEKYLPEGNGSVLQVPKKAPGYMLELYDRFSKNHFALPASNIIRSFKNMNEKDIRIIPEQELAGNNVRFHTLVFNITSIVPQENINLAELRLFTLVERDRKTYIGVDRIVSVFEVSRNGFPEQDSYRLVSSKHIYGQNSSWETFDVTSAIKRWIQNINSILMLEIRIQSVFSGVSTGDMDINTSPDNETEPLLVVYSNDESKPEVLHKRERHELVTHELDNQHLIDSDHIGSPEQQTIENESNRDQTLPRIKRSKNKRPKTPCQRRPMFVDFEDIGWHTWIIAPRGYQAYECFGKCYFPFSDHLNPSKHAIVQAMMHATNPKKASRVCCVPTKLEPISILYIDEQGVVTYKYQYDGMVVAECGCR